MVRAHTVTVLGDRCNATQRRCEGDAMVALAWHGPCL